MSLIMSLLADVSLFEVALTMLTLCAIEEVRTRLPGTMTGDNS